MKLLNLSAIILVVLTGCASIEHSAGQVLGNANSVVRTESPKVWVQKDGAAAGDSSSEEEKKRRDNRY